jgi:hypothetical protein
MMPRSCPVRFAEYSSITTSQASQKLRFCAYYTAISELVDKSIPLGVSEMKIYV